MQCRDKKVAPRTIEGGHATSDGEYAYFIREYSSSVYRYKYGTEKWDKLPPCPNRHAALVIIDGALTAMGGFDDRNHDTNKLFTFRERDVAFSMKLHKTYSRWVEELPPMKTPCWPCVASTSDGECVFVIGKCDDATKTTAVELFQVRNRRWLKLNNLPHPCTRPSATVCGTHLYVVNELSSFSCSIKDLTSSDQPSTLQSTVSWSPLPPLPARWPIAATLCGQLVLVGGMLHLQSVDSIHQLVDGQWVEIGSMTVARLECLVVSPSPDKVMIVGGSGRSPLYLDSAEECLAV